MIKDKKKQEYILTKCKRGHEIRVRAHENPKTKKCATCYNSQIKKYRESLYNDPNLF
jgi:hypothetical protein